MEDFLKLNKIELNFSKKMRGRNTGDGMVCIIPKILTKGDCVSKVAGVWDPRGGDMKLDISESINII